jgi:cytoskeletal protein RodZ
MLRNDLGQTIGHLKQAATQGAGGVGTAMRPRMSAAKTAAMGTAAGAMARMAAARKTGATQAGEMARKAKPTMGKKKQRERRMARKRAKMLGRLLALGTAVGAVGALIARRRRQTLWTEYDATQTKPQTPTARPPQAPVQMSESGSPGASEHGVGSLSEQARGSFGSPAGSAEADVVSTNERPRNIRS